MAEYDAVRDSFQSFNRMLIDAQQWDVQHAQRAEDRKYKNAVLQSNLVQQEFENNMANRSMALRVQGEDRLADAEDRLLADQRFDHNYRTASGKRDERTVANTEANSKLSRQKTQLEVNALEVPVTPVDVSLSGLVPPHLAENDEFMSRLNETTGEFGAFVDVDLNVQVMDIEGRASVMQLSPNDQEKFIPGIMGLIAEFDDPNVNAKHDIEKLELQISDLTKISSKSNPRYNQKDGAEARRMIHTLEAERDSKYEAFRPTNDRDSLMDRANTAETGSQWMLALGMSEQGKNLAIKAKSLRDQAIAADKTSKGQAVQTWNIDLNKNGVSTPRGKWVYDSITQEYRRRDKEGNLMVSTDLLADYGITTDEPVAPRAESGAAATSAQTRLDKVFDWGHDKLATNLNPPRHLMKTFADQSAGIAYVQKLYTEKSREPILNEAGEQVGVKAPRSNAEASEFTVEVMKEFKENHNLAYDDYLFFKKSGDKAKMDEWTAYALGVFGYLPIKPFVKQIWRGKVKTSKR